MPDELVAADRDDLRHEQLAHIEQQEISIQLRGQ